MEIHPLDWAYSQKIPSSEKFVLVTMAKVARPAYYAPIASVITMTGLNRKTVYKAITGLVERRLIYDLGLKVGRKGNVRVYFLRYGKYREHTENQAKNWYRVKFGTVPNLHGYGESLGTGIRIR